LHKKIGRNIRRILMELEREE